MLDNNEFKLSLPMQENEQTTIDRYQANQEGSLRRNSTHEDHNSSQKQVIITSIQQQQHQQNYRHQISMKVSYRRISIDDNSQICA